MFCYSLVYLGMVKQCFSYLYYLEDNTFSFNLNENAKCAVRESVRIEFRWLDLQM